MTKNLQQLIRESDALTRCTDCGEFTIDRSYHRCTAAVSQSAMNRENRIRQTEKDRRADETAVGIFRRSKGQTYAYHELAADGSTLCGGEARTKAETLKTVTLAEAKRLGRTPCGTCHRHLSR